MSAVEGAQQYLSSWADSLASQVLVKTAVSYGDAPGEVLATVEKHEADGIVMATHGRTGLAHLLHGSVAQAVLAHSAVPVFVVHALPIEAVGPPADSAHARIMVPLDGSSMAEAALPSALDMLSDAGELVLVCVVSPPDHVEHVMQPFARAYLDHPEEPAEREAHIHLREVVVRLHEINPDDTVQMDPSKRLAWIGAPVSEEPILDVFGAQRLSEQGIVVQADHPPGKDGYGLVSRRRCCGTLPREVPDRQFAIAVQS